jgi:predicted dehydrogenase
MRIAVVGLGFMGATHIRAIQKVAGLDLAAVVDRNEERFSGDLSAIQGNLGDANQVFDFSQVKKYQRFPDAFADPDIDAVSICLPTLLHASISIAALRAGKHVLVEKPMAADPAGAAQMIEEARKAGKVLMAAQVLRFFPAYTALKEFIDSGRLGAIRSAVFRRRCAQPRWSEWLRNPESGGGVFDLLIHDVDMCLHLFGKPRAATATGYENLEAGVDLLDASLLYEGLSASVSGGWHHAGDYPFSMEYTVVGDRGVLEFSSASAVKGPTFYAAGGGQEAVLVAESDAFAEEIAYFAECCRKAEEPARCRPEESAEAVRLTRALQEARRNPGERIEWHS